jgi:hypothetical protein
MAGCTAYAEGRLSDIRREVDRAAFQAGSCSCKNGVVVKGGTGRTGWRADIEAVVVVRRPSAALEEVASVVADRSQDCMVVEVRRIVDREECSAVAEQAVDGYSAAVRGQAWVA